MGLFQGIANLGIAGSGYEQADKGIRDRDWQERQRAAEGKMTDLAVAEALRKDELAKAVRNAVQAVGPRAAARGLYGAKSTSVGEGDPGENNPGLAITQTEQGADLPQSPDLAGKLNAEAQARAAGGDTAGAMNAMAAVKQLHAEGYNRILDGVVKGRDVKSIADDFNQVGQKRIVGGNTDGDRYTFKYEDGTESAISKADAHRLGTQLGIFKRDPLQIIPQGGTAIDSSGNVMARGQDKPRNTDPNSPEVIAAREEARQKREEAAIRLRASLAKTGDGKPREVKLAEAMVEAHLAADMNEGIRMAMEGKNVSPERFRANILTKMVADDPPPTADDARKKHLDRLRKVADDLTSVAFPPKTAKVPPEGQPLNTVPPEKVTGKYTTADEVRAAFRSGRISREDAKAALKNFGFQ